MISALRVASILLVFSFFARGQNPDRQIDGKKLANRVTATVLDTGDIAAARAKTTVPDLLAQLSAGNEFSPASDPSRKQVKAWLLAQPDYSVEPHHLFEKCLHVSNGNAQRALMLGWDVLREDHWRVPARNGLELTQKLHDITGEQAHFDGNFIKGIPVSDGRSETIRGDNYSAWYHFYGTALSAYMSGGTTKTKAAIWCQANLCTSSYVDGDKRVAFDDAGADFGAALSRNLEHFTTREAFAGSAVAKDVEYLFDDPKRWGGKWSLKPGQRAKEFGTDSATKDGPTMMERIKELRKLIGREDAASLDELRRVITAPRTEIIERDLSHYIIMVDGPDEIVRAHAIALLGRRHDAPSRETLVSLIDSSHAMDREASIRALGTRGDPEFLKFAVKLARDKDILVREAVIRSLVGRPYSPELDEIFRAVQEGNGPAPAITELHRTIAAVVAEMPGEVPAWLRQLGEQSQLRTRTADDNYARTKASGVQTTVILTAAKVGAVVTFGALLWRVSCKKPLNAVAAPVVNPGGESPTSPETKDSSDASPDPARDAP